MILAACLRLASHEPDWDKFQKQVQKQYEQKCNDTGRDITFKQFLDDKLITLPDPDNMKDLKLAVKWIALYKVNDEQLPKVANEVLQSVENEIADLDADTVTWEQVLDRIKQLEARRKK